MTNDTVDMEFSDLQDSTLAITIEPPVSSPTARSRFEFEPNVTGNGGSKILMIEWEENDFTRRIAGTWSVQWEGMPPQRSTSMESEELNGSETSSLSAKTTASEDEINMSNTFTQRSPTHRRYFLIGPRRGIPPTVTITLNPVDENVDPVIWKTNPLPAIYPKPLLSDDHGRLGVLHTQWAKMRLASLDREIETEARLSPEGVALHMALSERDWIVKKFGVGTSLQKDGEYWPALEDLQDDATTFRLQGSFGVLQSERIQLRQMPDALANQSLSEKLKSLKLQTPSDDVAIPLCSRKVEKLMTAASNNSQPPSQTPQTAATMGSIGAMLATDSLAPISTGPGHDDEAELFALPLSPRSPEMTKSPFTFAAEDTRIYVPTTTVS